MRTPQELLALMDTIFYFVHLKMHVLEQNAAFTVPRDVDRIIELARGLPRPRPDEWGSLAVGRISTKRTFFADGTEEIKRIRRRVWKAEDNQTATSAVWGDHEKSSDLIRLVQNASYRERILGTQGLAWDAIAAHLGVAEQSARDKYREMTGIQ